MSANPPEQKYKDIIDVLVVTCQVGQGQIAAQRARRGLWNLNATSSHLPDEHSINELLKALPANDREAIATMLTREFEAGVFEVLKTLGQHNVSPFENSFEGSAYEDFVGRLGGWQWPKA